MHTPLTFVRLVIAIAVAMLVAYVMSAAAAQPPPNTAERVFQDRLTSYMHLRADLAELADLPFEPTDARTAAALRRRLGPALRIIRAEVQQGAVFAAPVAALFRQIVGAALADEQLHLWVEARADGALGLPHARVNGSLPMGAQHDVHSALLRLLPALPRGLEYRVLHYDLLLWDVGADVVIDVLPAVFAAETI